MFVGAADSSLFYSSLRDGNMICRQGVAVGKGGGGLGLMVNTNHKRLTAPNEEGVKGKEASCARLLPRLSRPYCRPTCT